METYVIRWILAGLFVAFLLIVALSDLAGRRTSARDRRAAGFRHRRHRPAGRHKRWKTK